MATNNKPANTLRCGNIKATIWQKDKYKRKIADVILPDGLNLNQERVKQG
jgi:endonuclease YncB( thermonuclease family)